MAVAQDVVSSALRLSGALSGTNANTTMTVSASATLALCFVDASLQSGNSDASIGFSVMTLGGNAFTQVTSARKHSGSDSDTGGFVDIYYLYSPPTGSQSFSVTMTHSGTPGAVGQLIAYCMTFTGSATSAALGTAKVSNGQFVSSLTITDTLTANDYFVGYSCNGTAAPGVTTGTSDATTTGSGNTASDNSRLAHNTGSGSTSIVFSTNSGDYSAATGVKISPPTSSFIASPPLVIAQAVSTAANW